MRKQKKLVQKPVEVQLCRALEKEVDFFIGSSKVCRSGRSETLTPAIVSNRSFSEAMFGPLCYMTQVNHSGYTKFLNWNSSWSTSCITIAKTWVPSGGSPNNRSSSITLSFEGPNQMLLANMIFACCNSPNHILSESIHRSDVKKEWNKWEILSNSEFEQNRIPSRAHPLIFSIPEIFRKSLDLEDEDEPSQVWYLKLLVCLVSSPARRRLI